MTGCIYHEADLDGVMSAAIVKKYFKGDIDLLPYNYGKEIPDVNKYDKVFVVDVSFGSRTRFLFDEWKEKGIDVVWIDHHKTAIDDMRDYEVKGKRRIGTAACELTWELPTLWTRSFYVESVGHISEQTIIKYIENQKNI